MKDSFFKLTLFIVFTFNAHAGPDWSRGVKITSPRENLYELEDKEFHRVVMEGRKHALIYPVTVSKLTIPYAPLKNFLENDEEYFIGDILNKIGKKVSPFKSMDSLFNWIGVHKYPSSPQPENPNELPQLSAKEKELPMGATIFHTENGEGLTFGCAACHTSDLFGVKVLGLTNRFPRANTFFHGGALLVPYVNSFLFQEVLKTTNGERKIYTDLKESIKYVGTKKPQALGLDTSLAQVALSLAKRKDDAYASRTGMASKFPRANELSHKVADSKPAVWWNLKYKNRWLSDGSIVSGNPVHTNLLWNEIGRGTDLRELETWLTTNEDTINALTAAVFASKAPRYEAFFGPDSIKIDRAMRGEKLFVVSCQKCHGIYEKVWNLPGQNKLTRVQKIQTYKVIYPEETKVKNVGTDPGRYEGMYAFAADLNKLQISKTIGTVVEPQNGYVPPPLVGIWSRWPYFHNNSIPNLCALLTPSDLRPVSYYSGAANNKETDFDQECVGYPLGDKTPEAWKKRKQNFYNTKKKGLSNKGHDQKIFIKDGIEIFSKVDKLDLIEFLKTL